jgi:hypothetical protein
MRPQDSTAIAIATSGSLLRQNAIEDVKFGYLKIETRFQELTVVISAKVLLTVSGHGYGATNENCASDPFDRSLSFFVHERRVVLI